MAVKKVLVAVGLVCVVAPAAFAMISKGSGKDNGGYQPGTAVQSIVQQFAALWENGRQEEGRPPADAGAGESNLPFRHAKVIHQRLAEFPGLNVPGQEPDEPATSGTGGGVVGPVGGPIGQTEARQNTQSAAAKSMNGGQGFRNASFSAAGAGGFGGGSGAGGSDGRGSDGDGSGLGGFEIDESALGGTAVASGDESLTKELLALLDQEEQRAEPPTGAIVDSANNGSVTVAPLPASVWMLLASIAGLLTLRVRRHAGHV
jgi:hypothetical protein